MNPIRRTGFSLNHLMRWGSAAAFLVTIVIHIMAQRAIPVAHSEGADDLLMPTRAVQVDPTTKAVELKEP